MDYSNYDRNQLLERIAELETLNKELLEEKEQEWETGPDAAVPGNMGHWYWNLKTNRVECSPFIIEALGYSREELPESINYQFFSDRFHSEDYYNNKEAMRLMLQGKSGLYEVEYRIQTKDGEWKWVYDRARITHRDSNGNPEMVAGSVFDITERKEMEIEIEKQNELQKLRALTDPLTGILNRAALMDELENRMNQSLIYKTPLSICKFEITSLTEEGHPKDHESVDMVLKGIAGILTNTLRGQDAVGRYDKEEFMAIFPNTEMVNVERVVERIRSQAGQWGLEHGISIRISGGIAEYHGESMEEFMCEADRSLEEARKTRKRLAATHKKK